MRLRFRRSVSILPGVRLNLGLRGAGLSVGPRGLHVGVNRRGMYSSAGLPGTGLYAVHHFRTGEGGHEIGGSAGGCAMLAAIVLGLLFAMRAC